MLRNGEYFNQDSRFMEGLKIAGYIFSLLCGSVITILMWVATPPM
jgi:hypothetical protein